MSSGESNRARLYKAKTFRTQEQKRQDFLTHQKTARRNLAEHARLLALEDPSATSLEEAPEQHDGEAQVEQVDMEVPPQRKRLNYWAKKRLRDFYSAQLCTPEWMTEVPEDLNGSGSTCGQGWYVMCRPEGKRCLMISAKGRTITRMQHGEVLHKFSSNLPNGGPDSGFAHGFSILDVIFHESDQTYYVLDMMCWKVRKLVRAWLHVTHGGFIVW